MTRPFIATWTELSAYLTGAIQRTRYSPHRSINESVQQLGAQEAFIEIRDLIWPMVTAELADRAKRETADVL